MVEKALQRGLILQARIHVGSAVHAKDVVCDIDVANMMVDEAD